MESTQINKYVINDIYTPQKKNQCTNVIGLNCKQINNKSNNLIDNESLLFGIKDPTRKQSFRNESSFIAKSENNSVLDNLSFDKRQSIMSIGDTTRTGRACNVLSGITIDRFEYPHINPLQHLQKENNIDNNGLHTRNYTKDCFTKNNFKELKIDKKHIVNNKIVC